MLTRIKNAIDECKKHIASAAINGTVIEYYLTQYLLILLSADMQQSIYECIEIKTSQIKNTPIENYILSTRKNIIREVSISGVTGFIKHFGNEARQRFDDFIKDKEEIITRYGNAITDRHLIAHNHDIKITFSEIEKAVEGAEVLLTAVTIALSIDK
ncbi:MAG: HEPN domain-containing protein [Candidatus Zixiibacteriota bacterium]